MTSSSTIRATNQWGIRIGLLLCVIFVFWHRIHWSPTPLERDISTYAVIGHELLQGRALYTDLWDHKPPGIHFSYALAEIISGYGNDAIVFLAVVTSLLTLFIIYELINRLTSSSLASLLGAGIWAIFSGDLFLEAQQPNTEAFINLFLSSALLCLVWNKTPELISSWVGIVSGIFIGLASAYKPIAVLPFVGFLTGLILFRGNSTRLVTAIFSGVASVWILVFGYINTYSNFTDFWEAVVIYNSAYAGSPWQNLFAYFELKHFFPRCLYALVPIVAFCIWAIIFKSERDQRLRLGFAAWGLGIILAIALPGQFYNHYYQLWLPWLCIVSGWGISILAKTYSAKTVNLFCVGLFGLALIYQLYFFRFSPAEWSIRRHSPVYLESQMIGQGLDNKPFFNWGSETGLYFYSQQSPPSGIFFSEPTLSGPLASKLHARLLNDLKKSPPELIFVSNYPERPLMKGSSVQNWIDKNYVPHPIQPMLGTFNIFVPRQETGG